MTFLLDLLPMIAGILLGICYVPQIIKTYQTKDVSSMSLSFWVILVLALSMLTLNAITIFVLYGTFGYMITEFFNVGLAVVMLVMVIKYRRKNHEKKR